MADSIELPEKCLQCAQSRGSKTHRDCDVCRELVGFQEAVLCDLNRCVQDETHLQCPASGKR